MTICLAHTVIYLWRVKASTVDVPDISADIFHLLLLGNLDTTFLTFQACLGCHGHEHSNKHSKKYVHCYMEFTSLCQAGQHQAFWIGATQLTIWPESYYQPLVHFCAVDSPRNCNDKSKQVCHSVSVQPLWPIWRCSNGHQCCTNCTVLLLK